MAKLLGCRRCHVEMTEVALADGSVAVVCVACEGFGLAHEVARGGPVWLEQGAFRRQARPPTVEKRAPGRSRAWVVGQFEIWSLRNLK